ncbi:MAG: hypothetical protein K9H61_06645 [Bacteroidia bacterium]|nr:hypothetical protein [Bacteroidia bacterium]MCF8425123.1 hypothetical protein [Bacteroidia bacterium]MCF8446656.1 hypothetical protein [Bacteroidia bacterium]
MKNTISIITILAIGAFAGNMLNIGLSYAIHWQSLNPIDFMNSFKVDFPLLLSPTAITLMPAWLGSLWVATKSKNKSASKKYWLYAFIGITLTIIQTSVYHLPMNLDFMALKYDAITASSKLQGWIISHWVRVIIAIASGAYALLGFQKSINQ